MERAGRTGVVHRVCWTGQTDVPAGCGGVYCYTVWAGRPSTAGCCDVSGRGRRTRSAATTGSPLRASVRWPHRHTAPLAPHSRAHSDHTARPALQQLQQHTLNFTTKSNSVNAVDTSCYAAVACKQQHSRLSDDKSHDEVTEELAQAQQQQISQQVRKLSPHKSGNL